MGYETEQAHREGARNAAEDTYFEARPQIDSRDRRRVFDAGFDRGWVARDNEVTTLKGTMMELLEILRQWEPDHASGEDRQTILRAMYQTGVLHDPAATIEAMQTIDPCKEKAAAAVLERAGLVPQN